MNHAHCLYALIKGWKCHLGLFLAKSFLVVTASFFLALMISNCFAGNISGTVRDLFTRVPVPNVRVFALNGITVSDTTDTNGNYTLNNVPNGMCKLLFISDSHLDAQYDSLALTGNLIVKACLPETIHINPDPSRSSVRVKAYELNGVFWGTAPPGRWNNWLWPTKSIKDIPITIRGFTSSDSTSIWNALRWRMNLGDTTYFKFVPGVDTSQGIYIRSGGMNFGCAYTHNGYIYWSYVELAGFDDAIVMHEVTYHAIASSSCHNICYSPSNYAPVTPIPTTRPKDQTYMDIAYEWQYSLEDSVNNLYMSGLRDTIAVGVEEESEAKQAKVRNHEKVVPNPFASFARVPGHEREDFSLYDISGRKVGVYNGDRIGEGLAAGVYFLKYQEMLKQVQHDEIVRIVKVR